MAPAPAPNVSVSLGLNEAKKQIVVLQAGTVVANLPYVGAHAIARAYIAEIQATLGEDFVEFAKEFDELLQRWLSTE